MQIKSITVTLSSLALVFLHSCAIIDNPKSKVPTPNPAQTKIPKAVFVNPYKSGSYKHFLTKSSYPKTSTFFINHAAYNAAKPSDTKIKVDLSMQRAFLMHGDTVLIDYPISSGQSKFPTPTGDYDIVEMIEADKRSNLYGKIYNAEGTVVNSNANSRKDEIPEGGRFEGALMKYWMRITWDGIGLHQGKVKRYPASHGCIRHPYQVVSKVFKKVRKGTPVSIVR